MIADGVVNVKELDVNLESIGGLGHIKKKLHETIILPLQRPEIFNDEHFLGPQKGVLLYGPPGTGKTMLAKALAKESSAVFINVRMSTVMSKWFGEAQKLGNYDSFIINTPYLYQLLIKFCLHCVIMIFSVCYLQPG